MSLHDGSIAVRERKGGQVTQGTPHVRSASELDRVHSCAGTSWSADESVNLPCASPLLRLYLGFAGVAEGEQVQSLRRVCGL